MKLYLVRHGETDFNKQKRVMGSIDSLLNEKGIEQAHQISDKLNEYNIDLIICSPRLRTKQTAEIINENKNIEIIYDERIFERNFGEFEGQLIEDFDFFSFWSYKENNTYLKAENIKDFLNRIFNFLDELKGKYSDKNILLVTHSGVNIAINSYLIKEIPDNLLDVIGKIANCEIKEYEIKST